MAARITRRDAPLNAASRAEVKDVQEPKTTARAAGGLHDASVARSAEKAEATRARLSGVLPPPRPPKDAAEPMRLLADGLTVHAKSGDLERELRARLQRTRENSGCSTPRAADDTDAPDAPSTGGSEEGPEISWTPPDGTEPSTDELMAALFGIMREEQERQNEDAQDQKDAVSGSRMPQPPASDDSGAPDSTGDEEPDDPGASDAAATVNAVSKALADLAAKAAKASKTAE